MTSHIRERAIKTIAQQLPALESLIEHHADMDVVSLVDDLGEDSLDRVELVLALEEEFEISISDEDGEKFTDVQSVIDYVESRRMEIAA